MNFNKFRKSSALSQRGSTPRETMQGFTIAELLVVLFIMVVITGVVLISWRFGASERALRRTAQLVALDIRYAQGLALASAKFNDAVPFGYGVAFSAADPLSYFIFADLGNDMEPDLTADPLTNELFSRTVFPSEISIKDLRAGDSAAATTSVSSLVVYFCPPDPKIYINPPAGSFDCRVFPPDADSEFGVAILAGGKQIFAPTRTVRVNKTGAVTIE